MKAIEKSRIWYENVLLPELQKNFPQLTGRLAVGVAGRGSECFGFDDEFSTDHDRLTGVSVWITGEDDRLYGVALEKFYRKLHHNSFPEKTVSSRMGYGENGVMTISSFFRRHIGLDGVPENPLQWLNIPEYALAEAVNGEVFTDDLGEFTRIREKLLYGMPEDVRRKKVAGHAVMMAQSGQYNFARCLKHGETAAAAVAIHEFVIHAVPLAFLLNFRFAPYYKWMFRAMHQLPQLAGVVPALESLLTGALGNDEKIAVIETIAAKYISVMREQGLSNIQSNYLEDHAFAVIDGIGDQQLRAMHIMDF